MHGNEILKVDEGVESNKKSQGNFTKSNEKKKKKKKKKRRNAWKQLIYWIDLTKGVQKETEQLTTRRVVKKKKKKKKKKKLAKFHLILPTS